MIERKFLMSQELAPTCKLLAVEAEIIDQSLGPNEDRLLIVNALVDAYQLSYGTLTEHLRDANVTQNQLVEKAWEAYQRLAGKAREQEDHSLNV